MAMMVSQKAARSERAWVFDFAAWNDFMELGPEGWAAFRARLGIKPGATTEDLKFSLEEIGCFGSCSLAPVVVIDTDPYPSTEAGGSWWEVAVPEVSDRTEVQVAREAYEAALSERD